MFHSLTKTLSAGLLAGAMVLLIGGCSSKYSNDLTPELSSYSRSETQDRNLHAKVIDNNQRQIWDDLARILLLDETSELTRYPVVP